MSHLRAVVCLSIMFVSFRLWGEGGAPYDPSAQTAGAPQGQAAAPTVRPLCVLPTTDTSNLNLGEYLQTNLAALYQQTQYYTVTAGAGPLPGFTEPDVARMMQATNSEIISFAYLEPERITLFLFDALRPKEFVVVAEQLVDPMQGNAVNQQVVDYKFKLAFNNLLTNYYQSQFQPLPSSQSQAAPQDLAQNPDDPQFRADESRRLFRELAALQETKTYAGATLGMARFSGEGDGSSSNVNFGGFIGYKLSDRFRGEFDLDIFSYTFASLSGMYQFPFAEKYLSIYASFGIGRVMGVIFGPRTANEPGMENGGVGFGPGLSFDIPLLGANIRGGLRLFIGSGSLLLGTYGLSYSI